MAAGETDWRELDEELRLLRWRTERLTALGFDFPRAVCLACSPVDIHELERLITKGCPLGTAVRITA
jgi:hypothetical protein